jgi:hypothetical protein
MKFIELANESGLVYYGMGKDRAKFIHHLEAFAALVAAQEREECAALCFSIWNKWLDTPEEDRYKVFYDAEDCAAAIRARGTT